MENEYKKITRFSDLYAWQEGHKLVVRVYSITIKFPQAEIFGLTSQMRRAAVSVTSNIAEGFSRKTAKDKMHFYYIAKGSLTELQNQFYVAKDVGYLKMEEFTDLFEQSIIVHKLINVLTISCQKNFN